MAADLTAADLRDIWSLLPYTAQALVAVLGDEPAARLLSARPGCTLLIPKHPDKHPAGARRWVELAEIIGDAGMAALAARYGGDVLDIPTCKAARDELRARAMRAEFDRLTLAQGLSGKQAVYEIGLRFAPISSRAVEMICGRADAGEPPQMGLF